jgi:4,5:9,10-diseco-3-hydroxy-5,9,17-trioxoandrosta-1(10),2-diene-4-oate hydrolase
MNDSNSTARQPPFGRLVTLRSGLELHVQEVGLGPPVVFLHGSGPGASAHSNFKQNASAIAAAGFRCILPDMPGFGWSSKPTGIDYTLDLFAESVIELLDALQLQRYAMIGNSLGGAVAMRIAILNPERVTGLVLMGPGGLESRETYFKMPGIQKMVSGFVGDGFDRAGLRKLLELITCDPKVITEELLTERINVLQQQPKDVLARMVIPDQTADLPEIRCPILGFWGMQDQFCPPSGYEKILAACPQSRFEMLARCGHWAMAEFPELFNRHTIEFLRGEC